MINIKEMENKKMGIESVINLSLDEAENQVVNSPYEETAKREDIIALYTKAMDHMDALLKESIQSGEFFKQIPSGHFDTKQFEPFSIPFVVKSESGTDVSFEVDFSDKDYTVLEKAFGSVFLKEKRKQVRRKK